MQTIASFGLPEISTGVMPGLDADKVPLWTTAENVLCDQYGVRPAPGYGGFDILNGLFDETAGMFDAMSGLFDSASFGYSVTVNVGEEIRGLGQSISPDGQRRLFYGTLTKLYVNTGVQTDVTRTPTGYSGYADEVPGFAATYWSIANWGQWIIATNGYDVPQIYKNSGTFTDLPDVQCSRAELAFVLGPHLVLANTSNGANVIEWSAQDDPEVWDFTVNSTAGRRAIRSFVGPIIAAVPLGRAYMLYGETQAHVMQYGGQFTFSTVPGPTGCGAVSKNSVVSVGGLNYGILPEGIFLTDGSQVQWISYPQFGRWLVDNVNWQQKTKIAGWYDPESRCIRWSLPRADGLGRHVLVCNTAANNNITFETETFSVGMSRGLVGYSFIGTPAGEVKAQRWDTAKPNRRLETKYIDCGVKDARKFISGIRLFSDDGTYRVSVGFADNVKQRPDWEYLGVVGDLTEHDFYFSRDTVYVKLLIECSDPSANWKIRGFDIMGKLSGRRY